jgi:hypothetical protein
VSWRVEVANRKVARRTGARRDEVKAEIEFSDHQPQPLKGTCPHFVANASIDFGSVRYIRPTTEFPGIRLRFTPAKGLIYGPTVLPGGKPDPVIGHKRAIYDRRKGKWPGFSADDNGKEFFNETMPPHCSPSIRRRRHGFTTMSRLAAAISTTPATVSSMRGRATLWSRA